MKNKEKSAIPDFSVLYRPKNLSFLIIVVVKHPGKTEKEKKNAEAQVIAEAIAILILSQEV